MNKYIDTNFQDDIEKSAPLLFNLKSEMDSDAGFRVPDGYFEAMTSEVMNKIASVPDFENAENVNPFNIPDGYFDSLPTIIQQRITDQNRKGNWITEIFYKPVPKYSLIIASIFLVLFFSIKYFSRTVKVEYVNTPDESEQMESFYLSQLDETVLLEAYSEEKSIAEESQESEIENYLLDNNIDLNLISEHL